MVLKVAAAAEGVRLPAGKRVKLELEFCNVRAPADGDEDSRVMTEGAGVRIGGAIVVDPDTEIERAVAAAREAEVAIVVVGLNADWESESYDRTTLDLPGRTNELVRRVAAANPRTIVVNQSVRAIPWRFGCG